MSKLVVLMLFALLALSNSVMVDSAFAQSIPTPSVPEFTVEFVGQLYDVPATYGLDPYTGENVTIPGYRVINGSIVLSIRNQPFDFSSTYSLYYKVRSQGHFETNNWIICTENLYVYDTGSWASTLGIKPSDGEYTVVSYPADYGPNSQVDFQVQVLAYKMKEIFYSDHPLAPPPLNQVGHYEQHPELFATSDWSKTQTVTIPGNPPNVTLFLVQNGNFSTSDVPLDFAVSPMFSQIEYSLDGGDNVTISGNMTLTGLTNGDHNVTVYSTDEFGNSGASETVHFNVEVPEPFPTLLVATASSIVATVVLVGIGLLLYGIKRK